MIKGEEQVEGFISATASRTESQPCPQGSESVGAEAAVWLSSDTTASSLHRGTVAVSELVSANFVFLSGAMIGGFFRLSTCHFGQDRPAACLRVGNTVAAAILKKTHILGFEFLFVSFWFLSQKASFLQETELTWPGGLRCTVQK